MPKISIAQKIGDIAQTAALTEIGKHPNWVARNQDRDYGIDLEAEFCEISGDLTGHLVKIQVKGSEEIHKNDRHVTVNLELGYLQYVYQFRLPVVLVAVETSTNSIWYLWLQAWMLENESLLSKKESQTTIGVKIPIYQSLNAGLSGELVAVAKGHHSSALTLSLRETAIAARNLGDATVFEAIISLVGKIDGDGRNKIVAKTIDALVGLGLNVGFWETQQQLPQILTIVRKVGHSLTAENLLRLVVRGESYSRTGFIGLAIFYDEWPELAQSFDLSAKFQACNLNHIAWYCEMREYYKDIGSVALWGKLANKKLKKTDFVNLKLAINPDSQDYMFRKWPTRGDTVLIDCLVEIE